MKNKQYYIILLLLAIIFGCETKQKSITEIDEDQMGFIVADVESEDTNLPGKAEFIVTNPGQSELIERSFENAPPMIPHTTEGFFPIKKANNICLSCHLPAVADSVGAVPVSDTHFASLRPKMVLKDGKYQFEEPTEKVFKKDLKHLNNSYFNCGQCHAPVAKVKVDITNLFTPEFRSKLDKQKSTLNKRVDEGADN
ncbi:nitrate reductase cytochrome c-type subunit; periplasmic nitrate reductase electron transfer subunit [Prolixibacteraceae bacterium JC049]|nr:nitrate reductase cytochrome c-type subunit; periplasmic nitrate reductase electron transfer subunit [Prolixibacteraceae bacterium JC049]